mmetsp:Transcript_32781/g.53956  ORF Transcript_32781/g.53956 Transcript_32781/m.53956 type:complete len:491 (-) Transcript_32781:41-1513(-)
MATVESAATPLGGKFSNFKSAVATHVGGMATEHEKRERRYESFVEHTGLSSTRTPRESAADFYKEKERRVIVTSSKIWTTDDFVARKVIGEGTFGVVYFAQIRSSGKLCALKQMKKAAYTRKNHRERIYGERDILSEAKCRWVVDLFCTFQDSENIYMAMEFLQGGDLVTHLLNKRRFSIEETRFYIAELLEALDVVHRYGFVHRDVKPDNTVLTTAGHLKLLDFGLCRQDFEMSELQSQLSGANERPQRVKSVVGTPEYMAPETFLADYGPEADVWSVGVITYELLVGIAPFNAGKDREGRPVDGKEKIRIIKHKIVHHESVLPEMIRKAKNRNWINQPAESFLLKVICDCGFRLSISQCRGEAFFGGLDFSRLHLMTPPIIPELSGPDDLKYFDEFPDKELPAASEHASRKDDGIDWANYEYDQEKSLRNTGTSSSRQQSLGYSMPVPPAGPRPGVPGGTPPHGRGYVELERWIAAQQAENSSGLQSL